jgi:WD40 repeat protein
MVQQLVDRGDRGQVVRRQVEGVAVFTPDGRNVLARRGTGGAEPGTDHDELVASSWRRGIDLNDTKIVVVDIATRSVVRTTHVERDGRPIAGFRNNTVDPDGRTVGLGGVIGDVIILDAATGERRPTIHAHDDFVESITFAPDHATFVTTGREGALAPWDAATQCLVGSILRPNHRLRASFVAADNVMIVDDSGAVEVWDPRPALGAQIRVPLPGSHRTHGQVRVVATRGCRKPPRRPGQPPDPSPC